MGERFLVIAPPPTPNGGLHVGHLSGPYLAADIFKRECLHRGIEAYYALSTDDNQSYVDTRAAKLGIAPDQLIASARSDIAETLDRYALACDVFGRNDQAYVGFVSEFFSRAYSAGLIGMVDTQLLYCEQTRSYLSEAFVKGHCRHCLAASCGGICESCGRPNNGIDLVPQERARLTVRTEPRLSVDLEASRGHLCDLFERCTISSPKLRGLLAEQMKRPLGRFTLSYQASRGIPVPVESAGDQRLNVWGEMYPGHFYHLKAACPDLNASDRYVQCFGYDNSYFYAIVHGALSNIARQIGYNWPMPSAFVVNRFYNLGYEKFSTSNGHAVWANDWATDRDTDLLRFYLALHGPEHDEASFFPAFADDRIDFLGDLINRLANAFDEACREPDDALRFPLNFRSHDGLGLSDFSMHAIANSALATLSFIGDRLGAGDEEIVTQIPLALKTSLASLCPNFAQAITVEPGRRMPRMAIRPLPQLRTAHAHVQ